MDKIEELENRIKNLESTIQKNLSLFGSSYAQVGSTNSDFLIKTKGKVKIQWGNKFIDLLKDGKLNTDIKFIYKDSSVGTKDGIYLVNDEVWLVANGTPINLRGEIGNTYVSFLKQETTSEQKQIALKNIGFIYNSLDEYQIDSGIQNGVIYVQDEQKLYIISQGNVTPLSLSIPNPFTEQFILDKRDDKNGALVINGQGIKNSVYFDSMFIYSENNTGIIDVSNSLKIRKGNTVLLDISGNMIKTIYSFSSDGIQSPIFSQGSYGYSIYKIGDKWILEVDKIVERDGQNKTPQNILKYLSWNIISSWTDTYSVQTLLENDFNVGDILEVNTESATYLLTVTSKTDDFLIVTCSDSIKENLSGSLIYLIQSANNPDHHIIKIEDNIDLLNNEKIVESRLGNLTNLSLNWINNGIVNPITGYGNYSSNYICKEARYTSDYHLDRDDNSSRIASTEWVTSKLKNQYNPGYYWANEVNNNIPVSPEYVGTTDLNFQVSEDKVYLLYTNDGSTWTIVRKYIFPESNRIYVLSTQRSSNIDTSTQKIVQWPAGFLCCYKNGELTQIGFGMSNYIPVYSNTNDLPTIPELSTLLNNAEAGIIPQTTGYSQMWSIEQTADKSNPNNWKNESGGVLPTSITLTDTSDWGNASYIPGYVLWEVDENDVIIGTPSETKYLSADGTEENWNNPIWRKSFLEYILADTLTNNDTNYDSVSGWRFNWSGRLRSMGYEGYWVARIGGIQAPTSDNPNDIGYFPTSTLPILNGQVMTSRGLILFRFSNIKLGKQLPYRFATSGYSIGDKLTRTRLDLYEVSYESCMYKCITDFSAFEE